MRFLGNKTRMLENLDEFIKKHNIKGKIFCDLFTGSSSVADHFKDRYQIIANDLLTSSCYYAKAKIYNSNVPEFNNFKKEKGVDPFTYFNLKEYEMLDGHFLLNNYSPKGDRMFLT